MAQNRITPIYLFTHATHYVTISSVMDLPLIGHNKHFMSIKTKIFTDENRLAFVNENKLIFIKMIMVTKIPKF